jgi:hypothetical protein
MFLTMQSILKDICMPYLAGIAFPSTDHPDPIRALTIPGSLIATPARYSLISDVACKF